MIRYGQTKAKVRCPYCDFPVYPGNLPRHTRKCLREQRVAVIRKLRRGDASAGSDD